MTIGEAGAILNGPPVKPKRRGAPRSGSHVVWPKGLEERLGISAPTRWRWEKTGRLPPRDVNLAGKTGWRPETLAAAERGAAASPDPTNEIARAREP